AQPANNIPARTPRHRPGRRSFWAMDDACRSSPYMSSTLLVRFVHQSFPVPRHSLAQCRSSYPALGQKKKTTQSFVLWAAQVYKKINRRTKKTANTYMM